MSQYGAVEPLNRDHRRDGFTCRSTALTEWLRKHALLANQTAMSRVYVVRRLGDGLVVGFYALAGGAGTRAGASARLLKGAGGYSSIPVVLLTRLAVDLSEEGHGLGRALVQDAFRRVGQAAEIVGIRALLIHAEEERAVSFYMKLANFDRSPSDGLHLLLLMKDLRAAMS